MWIDLTAADGHTLSAWKDGPEDAKKALVVVQEIFGVNSHMRHVCDRFVQQGYAVIAPALFDRTERGVELGYTAEDVARGRELRSKVPEAGTIADIEAAAAALPSGAKKGIVGYCWGGTVAWWGATRTRSFAAANGWYGGGIAGTRNETPNCPVELHFGTLDTSIPMKDVEAIREAQPNVTIFVYEGGQHGFGCDDRGSYNKELSEQAWGRTLDFFRKHLG
ncbi:dienelactone hydrolase family protein [Roseomonas sp. AR75]|uniref:dienelactone hydrolase family protein n=1 Tax=Roseomonas sp. AR75 TaxID=2562311 RepID=UPI0010C0056A|nr:dienelactone hydrolase family protein [Roseomonas sp. AR75]